MRHRSAAPSAHRLQHGFTVIEMVITLGILVIVLVGALNLFDLTANISRVQLDVADMQQSLRTGQYDMVRMLRMAGRGSVPTQVAQPPLPAAAPLWSLPNGIAVSVRNNVPAGETMDDPGAAWRILPNTDVLTLRGVFTSPVCTVVDGSFTVNSVFGTPGYGEGQMQVINTARPNIPVPQSLKKLADSIRAGVMESLIIVSAEDDSIFQIVELDPDPARTLVDDFDDPTSIQLAFRFTGGVNTDGYLDFSGGGWNPNLRVPGYVGIMEEFRYYVLDERENPAVPSSPAKPRLVRAQVYPGTQTAYAANPANWGVAIADNVADLQVALGIQSGGASPFDLDEDGGGTDEWLFNSPADVKLSGALEQPDRWRFGRLYYARLSATVFSERRDRNYAAPQNVTTEDHTYVVPEMGTANAQTPDRTYRRRNLKTVVDLRNL